ncbi:MAG: hypothetical protein U1E39_16925 [Planctomycetota bacterium]
MRSTILVALAGLACVLPGCGGGGGGGGLGGALALQGLVTSRNGTTQNLAGVRITCPESGDVVTTALNGRFALDVPKGVVLHLEVDDPAATPDGTDAEDCTEAGDGDDDGSDIAGAEVEIEALAEDETCGVELEIVDGKVVDIRVTKEKGGGAGRKESGEGVLLPLEGSGLEAYGEVEVGAREGCSWAEVEVRGLPLGTYTAVLVAPDSAATETLGTLVVKEKEAHFAVESCNGDRPLPFGAASVAELAGYRIEIRDATDTVVLEGSVPQVGADDVKEDDDKDDDGTKDGEEGKGEDGEGEKD